MSDITNHQERRVAVLRKERTSPHLLQHQLNHITKDEHAQLGLIAEFVLAGFLKPAHLDGVHRWEWTPAAKFALDIFDPRKGRHE